MRVKNGHMPAQRRNWGIVFFLSGILLALLSGDGYMADNPLSTYHLNNFVTQTSNPGELFITILWERGKLFFFLMLLCTGIGRRWMDKAAPVLLAVALGIYGGICLSCQGIWGVGIFLFTLFPHAGVYGFVLYLMLHKKKPIQYSGKRYILTEIVSVFVMLVLIAAGCLLEATAGSWLLRHYLMVFISARS
jgi:hypothetical protein